MITQELTHLIPYLLSAGISAAIGTYAWGKSISGSRQFAYLAFAQAAATLGFALERMSSSLESKLFWTNIQTIAFFAWLVAYLAFALRFTGRPSPERKTVWAALATPYVIFLLLLFSDPLHSLVRVDFHLEPGEPFSAWITMAGLQLTELLT